MPIVTLPSGDVLQTTAERVAASEGLTVEPLDVRGGYMVGEEHVHLTDVMVDACTCGDYVFRSVACKHILACLRFSGQLERRLQ